MGNILINSLEKKDKVLLIETEDDMISAKESFNGLYQKLLEEDKCEIVGPYFVSDLEHNIEDVVNQYLSKDIKSIYASRFQESIIEHILKQNQYELKIVTIGLSGNIKNYIKNNIVLASVTQDYYKIGYMAVNILFDYLYKGIMPDNIRNEYECRIVVKENL